MANTGDAVSYVLQRLEHRLDGGDDRLAENLTRLAGIEVDYLNLGVNLTVSGQAHLIPERVIFCLYMYEIETGNLINSSSLF